MRHRKSVKLGRTTSHSRCLISNLLKSFIDEGRIVTTLSKAKELRRHADKMVTLAKKNTLASRRLAISKLMIRYNTLSSKEARLVKSGKTHLCNRDRQVLKKLFFTIGPRFENRNGGYTRIVKGKTRVGDNAPTCILEFLES